jgi:hypothetical protein
VFVEAPFHLAVGLCQVGAANVAESVGESVAQRVVPLARHAAGIDVKAHFGIGGAPMVEGFATAGGQREVVAVHDLAATQIPARMAKRGFSTWVFCGPAPGAFQRVSVLTVRSEVWSAVKIW